MIPYDDNGFREAMRTTVRPWLENTVTSGRFTSFDGAKICYYRALNPDAQGVIVMVHGFCEFFGKFHETAYDFWESGYTVYFIEQRGHGGSDRSVSRLDYVDVTDFSEYVEDLKQMMDKVVLPETRGLVTRAAVAGGSMSAGSGRDISPQKTAAKMPGGGNAARPQSGAEQSGAKQSGEVKSGAEQSGAKQSGAVRSGAMKMNTGTMSARGGKLPILLYAHSMGGCVSTLFLEKYPGYFQAAVLSSPMLKMTFGSIPLWQVKALMLVSRLLGWNENTMPGQNGFDPQKPDFEGSASLSEARFFYQWDLRTDPESGGIYTMNGGTYRWGRAAWKATQDLLGDEAKITIPVLVCQAGLDYFVDNEGQDHFVKTAPNARLVRFPEAKHEIYGSEGGTLKRYYSEILGFYRSVTSPRDRK